MILSYVIEHFGKDLSPGRMFESFVLLTIIWSKLKPHLNKIETRLMGLELAIKKDFDLDAARFEQIEGRVKVLEGRII